MAFAEIVVYKDIVTLFDQLFDDHAANVTGPAGDQNLHESLIDLTRRVNAPPIYECAAGGTPRVLNRAARNPARNSAAGNRDGNHVAEDERTDENDGQDRDVREENRAVVVLTAVSN